MNKIFIAVSFLLITVPALILPSYAQTESQEKTAEIGMYYTIQKGDTLWDLSEKFLDSSWQWPELWHENRQITNPHWIFPGEIIRLIERQEKGIYIPTLSASPVQTSVNTESRQQVHYKFPSINQVGFIRKEPAPSYGIVIKAKDNKKMISDGDIIYIKQIDPSLPITPGMQFTAFKLLNPLPGEKHEFGDQYYLTGVVEIIEKKPQIVTAKVLQAFREISVGDQIMPYQKLSANIPRALDTPEIEGIIIAAEEHNVVLGEHTIAFIDKGYDDGMRPGQHYGVFYQETLKPTDGDSTDLLPVDFGGLLVLRTEKETATVLITQTEKTVTPGDKFHTIYSQTPQ